METLVAIEVYTFEIMSLISASLTKGSLNMSSMAFWYSPSLLYKKSISCFVDLFSGGFILIYFYECLFGGGGRIL
jgi:hypothetical protein